MLNVCQPVKTTYLLTNYETDRQVNTAFNHEPKHYHCQWPPVNLARVQMRAAYLNDESPKGNLNIYNLFPNANDRILWKLDLCKCFC